MAALSPDTQDYKDVKAALSEWNGTQGIRWLHRAVAYLAKIEVSQREAGRLMYEYVCGGGTIDRVKEEREEYRGLHEYHYDLRMNIGDEKDSYIEMRLVNESRFQPPHLVVVNAKPK